MSVTVGQSIVYCRTLIARADRDRYLSSLLAPGEQQPDLWAIYAFNTEIASIRDSVSEPQLGEIRLQWWRDAIAAVYSGGSTADHPVMQALAPVIARTALPQHAFANMIEARRFDLYDDPMLTMNDLEGYLGETSSMLMQMAARILAGEAAHDLAEVSGYAGVAYGLTGLMRALPVHCARGQCYMPLDVLARCELTTSDLLSRRASASIDLLLSKLRHKAGSRLAEARAMHARVPPAALPAYWPASLVDVYLKRLARPRGNPLKVIQEVSQLRCQTKLWWMARRGTF